MQLVGRVQELREEQVQGQVQVEVQAAELVEALAGLGQVMILSLAAVRVLRGYSYRLHTAYVNFGVEEAGETKMV